eukprot:182459-Chlamydomonas_euryale.AAC.1
MRSEGTESGGGLSALWRGADAHAGRVEACGENLVRGADGQCVFCYSKPCSIGSEEASTGVGLVNGALCNDCDVAAEDVEVILGTSEKPL